MTIRILFCDPAWFGRTGTVVNRTLYGAWVRPDEWPPGEPDPVGRGEMWFDAIEIVEVERVVQEAA